MIVGHAHAIVCRPLVSFVVSSENAPIAPLPPVMFVIVGNSGSDVVVAHADGRRRRGARAAVVVVHRPQPTPSTATVIVDPFVGIFAVPGVSTQPKFVDDPRYRAALRRRVDSTKRFRRRDRCPV